MRRARRKRWWPGRGFFLVFLALLGCALGCAVTVALTSSATRQLATLVTGVPVVCVLSAVSSSLTFFLPWIAPALAATTIARERELGTLDLLRATLLTERSIVLGKLGGCLVRLWPGLLALALLSPFQLILVLGGSILGSPSSGILVAALGAGSVSVEDSWPWSLLLLIGMVGLFRPWAGLAFNSAVGVAVSAVARSSGVAILISYGAILAARVAMWVLASVLGWVPLLLAPPSLPAMGLAGAATTTVMMTAAVLPGLIGLFVEISGAILLVGVAIWSLRRI